MTDTGRPLRAAVIGLGMMGRAHVRVWDELVEGVELGELRGCRGVHQRTNAAARRSAQVEV